MDGLNEYLRTLHYIHTNGLTVQRAVGLVLRNKDLPNIALSFPSADVHSVEEMNAMKAIVHQMIVNAEAIDELQDNPLKIVATSDWSNAWQQRMVAASSNLLTDAEKLSIGAKKLLGDLKLEIPELSLDQVGALAELAGTLIEAENLKLDFALEPNIKEIIEKLEAAKGILQTYFEEQEKLSVKFKDHAWRDIPIEEFESKWRATGSTWWPKSIIGKILLKKSLGVLGGTTSKPDPEKDLPVLGKMKIAGLAIEALNTDLKLIPVWKKLSEQKRGNRSDCNHRKKIDRCHTAHL